MLHLASFRKFSGVALAALALVLPAASRAQTGYTLIDLGALGGAYVSGSAISIQGCKNLRVVLPKQGIKGTATLPDVDASGGQCEQRQQRGRHRFRRVRQRLQQFGKRTRFRL